MTNVDSRYEEVLQTIENDGTGATSQTVTSMLTPRGALVGWFYMPFLKISLGIVVLLPEKWIVLASYMPTYVARMHLK